MNAVHFTDSMWIYICLNKQPLPLSGISWAHADPPLLELGASGPLFSHVLRQQPTAFPDLLMVYLSFPRALLQIGKAPRIRRAPLLTCSMSAPSACSTVARPRRSFVSSPSSASLRSSIKRSVASSCLWERNKRALEWRRVKGTYSRKLTWRWTWVIGLAAPFCLGLRVESSTPLWLKWEETLRALGVEEPPDVYFRSRAVVGWRTWSFVPLASLRQLGQTLRHSGALLLSAFQLCLLVITPQL